MNAWKWILGAAAVGVVGYVALAPSTAKADDNLIGPGGIPPAWLRYFDVPCADAYRALSTAGQQQIDAILANVDKAPGNEARAIVLDHAADDAAGTYWETCFRSAAAKLRAPPPQ